MEHRVWATAIVVETFLPLCSFNLKDLWQQAISFITSVWAGNTAGGKVRVVFNSASASSSDPLRLPQWLSHGIVIVYGCILVYVTARLAWAAWKTHRLRQQAQPVKLTGERNARQASVRFDHFARLLHFDRGQLSTSHSISGPVTIGIRSPTLLLPSGFLDSVEEEDLDTVFAHELAHMLRRDFGRNLLYELLSLPLSFHPTLWLIRSRLAETREMVCDEIAAEAIAGKDRYARSLLRLASMLSSHMPERNLHAIGIFDANNFERRVMNLTTKRIQLRGFQQLLVLAACATVALATCVSAIALRMDVSGAQAQTESKKIHVKADDLKILSQVPPVYPPKAKEAKIEGSVVLEVIIGKDGVPEHISIQKGPKELQASALDAVRQWRYQPFLLNGDPVQVETTITVTYALAG
jgi:bla regulator protein blaR1